jgi:hypothetical protein
MIMKNFINITFDCIQMLNNVQNCDNKNNICGIAIEIHSTIYSLLRILHTSTITNKFQN